MHDPTTDELSELFKYAKEASDAWDAGLARLALYRARIQKTTWENHELPLKESIDRFLESYGYRVN
jgi:hypothetical protein